MKFVTVKGQDNEFIGLVDESENRVLPLKRAWQACFGNHDFPETLLEFTDKVQQLVETVTVEAYLPLDSLTLLAPIPTPRKNIFCVGKNYAEHAIEMGSKEDIPTDPIVFSKAPTSVIGSGAKVLNHQEVTDELDYEGELAVIMGKKGRGISRE